jgi:RNA polymerase sigma-70 factor (ECF subfamily)
MKKVVFLPWVMRISHNLVIDHFRKTKKCPCLGNRRVFYFSIMSDDSQTIENKIISEQVEVDLKS